MCRCFWCWCCSSHPVCLCGLNFLSSLYFFFGKQKFNYFYSLAVNNDYLFSICWIYFAIMLKIPNTMIFGDSTENTGSGVFLPSINLSNDLLLLADFNETLSNEVTVCDLAKLTCLILKAFEILYI